MSKTISPSVETTRDFILIKIPRKIVAADVSVSKLERGLRQSLKEARAGKLRGPYKNAKILLENLKKEFESWDLLSDEALRRMKV